MMHRYPLNVEMPPGDQLVDEAHGFAGQFGMAGIIAAGGAPVQLVRISADPRAAPRPLTLQWWATLNTVVPGAQTSRPRLDISWGGGPSARSHVRIDALRGGTLVLGGSSLTVDAIYEGAGYILDVSATCYVGNPGGGYAPPTYTELPAVVAAGAASAPFGVREFARRVRVLDSISPLGPVLSLPVLQFYPENPAAPGNMVQADGTNGQWIDIPAGAENVVIVNGFGPAGNSTYILQWELAL